jgi:hypothetical protein
MARSSDKPEVKRPVGRPTEYKPEYCETVKMLLKEGKALKQIYAVLDVSQTCFNEWREKHPEFGSAVNDHLSDAEAAWIEKGMKNLDNKNFNAALYSFMMQNLHKWSRKTEQSGTVTIKHEEVLKELE